jgi:hypothetical protein
MRLKSSSRPLGITIIVPGLHNERLEAGGTQNKSRSLGPATHPLSPFRTKGVELQSSWDAPSVNSEVLHNAWLELDEELQSSWDAPSVNSEVLHNAWVELDEKEMV